MVVRTPHGGPKPRGRVRVMPTQIGIVLLATFFLVFVGGSFFLGIWLNALIDHLTVRELVAKLPFGVQLFSWSTIGAAWVILFGISGLVYRVFSLADDTLTGNVLISYPIYLTAFIGGFAWMYLIMDQTDSLLLSLKVVGGLDVVERATPDPVVVLIVIQRLSWEICWAVIAAGVFFGLQESRRRILLRWERAHSPGHFGTATGNSGNSDVA
jgi:hypothetical protein